MNHILTLSLCGLVMVHGASAQMVEKINASTGTDASALLKDVRAAVPPLANAAFEWHDTHDLANGEGTADFAVAEFRAPFYYRELANGMKFGLGVDYGLVDMEVAADGVDWSGQLHSLYLPVSMTYRKPGSEWYWIGQASPGLRTDFEAVGGDDLAFRAFLVAMRPYGPNLNIGYGGYVSYDPDGWFVVPGIGFTWKPAEDWLVALIPPQFTISYSVGDDWQFSIYARPRSFVADIGADDGPDFASVSYGKAGLAVKRRLLDSPHLWLNLNVGYTLYSEVELERDGRSLIDGDLDQGFFAGAALELLGW